MRRVRSRWRGRSSTLRARSLLNCRAIRTTGFHMLHQDRSMQFLLSNISHQMDLQTTWWEKRRQLTFILTKSQQTRNPHQLRMISCHLILLLQFKLPQHSLILQGFPQAGNQSKCPVDSHMTPRSPLQLVSPLNQWPQKDGAQKLRQPTITCLERLVHQNRKAQLEPTANLSPSRRLTGKRSPLTQQARSRIQLPHKTQTCLSNWWKNSIRSQAITTRLMRFWTLIISMAPTKSGRS